MRIPHTEWFRLHIYDYSVVPMHSKSCVVEVSHSERHCRTFRTDSRPFLFEIIALLHTHHIKLGATAPNLQQSSWTLHLRQWPSTLLILLKRSHSQGLSWWCHYLGARYGDNVVNFSTLICTYSLIKIFLYAIAIFGSVQTLEPGSMFYFKSVMFSLIANLPTHCLRIYIRGSLPAEH